MIRSGQLAEIRGAFPPDALRTRLNRFEKKSFFATSGSPKQQNNSGTTSEITDFANTSDNVATVIVDGTGALGRTYRRAAKGAKFLPAG